MPTSRPPVHRLSDASLAALAGGRPDAATVAQLRRAQFSRHLLLLRGIVRAAPAATAGWYDELAAAERHAPGPVRDVLRQPLVGAWAAGCLAALRAGVPPEQAGVRQLGTLAGLAAARAGLPSASGGPPAEPARQLTVQHDRLRLAVHIEDADPLRARLGLTPTGRLTDAELAHWGRCLRAAWRLLVTRHRHHAELISTVLTCIVPVEPDTAARGVSATSAHAFGAVAMSAPADGRSLAVGLLHETQHSVLNAVQYLFDLLDDGDPATGARAERPCTHHPPLMYSPWRDDPRPAAGLLHGAYAYLAVTDFWRAQRRDGDPVAEFEFARWRSTVLDATGDLLSLPALTPAGTRFVTALRDRVLPWPAEPVPPAVLRLAEGANVDHRVRWRLRHLAVDPAAVTALADAWRSHRPPEPGCFGTTLRAAPRRALESSARLDLTHRVLAGAAPDAGSGTPAPGDVAYVRGDLAGAAAAYRRQITLDPGDRAAWAGLALTSAEPALRERPEVVAAVHRALVAGPGTDVDPVALASWTTSVR